MTNFNTTDFVYADEAGLREYLLKVFTRMGMALAITSAVAWIGYNSLLAGGMFASLLMGAPFISLLLVIAQFGFCIALSSGLRKFTSGTCTALFYGYAFITGVTFSVLPFTYGVSNVFTAFGFAAVMFASCVVIGRTTNADLSKLSGLLFGGLLALIVASLVSLFVPALRNSLTISYIGIILFLVLTAYDMQKIKHFYYMGGSMQDNLAVYGAFQLYLDFINLFLYILRVLANNRSRRK